MSAALANLGARFRSYVFADTDVFYLRSQRAGERDAVPCGPEHARDGLRKEPSEAVFDFGIVFSRAAVVTPVVGEYIYDEGVGAPVDRRDDYDARVHINGAAG